MSAKTVRRLLLCGTPEPVVDWSLRFFPYHAPPILSRIMSEMGFYTRFSLSLVC